MTRRNADAERDDDPTQRARVVECAVAGHQSRHEPGPDRQEDDADDDRAQDGEEAHCHRINMLSSKRYVHCY